MQALADWWALMKSDNLLFYWQVDNTMKLMNDWMRTDQDLALNVDNVFQADDCDAFDFDVDEASTAQTMFMENLSSVYPVYDEASPSYDSDILSEVPDHDNYQDAVCEHHEVHEMHDDVQPNYVVDSHADYTSDSNMIPYVKDNAISPQYVSVTTQNNVVDKSLTAELATYKEQVELYERRAKFELTEREQKIDEQLRIVITDRNIKEENLKRELQSVNMHLNSTINHNKSMVEEVTSLEKDFKQKENKYLEEFLDMKALKEKVEDRLFKPDQSQTNLSIFTDMHNVHTAVQARCRELEAELSKLKDKIQKDDHNEMVKHFSHLEVNHLNLQLKYQHLKESFGNKKSLPARDAPDFDSVFEIGNFKASIQGKDNAIKKLRIQISQLKETRSDADRILDFRALDF
ncbi:hypothetical protein Tco_0651575 [Tanacetum coccineum]|uniref:Uncharacterized protein n=1 Tax=Tanacetum coccineum TaxID=301880 RepID=A0ABQ4WVU3_9ASTR